MSMLSAQVNELRELATRYDELQVGAVRAIKVPLDMGPILRDAADVIDRLDAENAKLRGQVAEACMQLGGARVRCTELRELACFIMHQCNDGNPRCDECIDWNDGECVALLRMRELGAEVDDAREQS